MILSLKEMFDMVLMTLFVGFIFKDTFSVKPKYEDPLDYYTKKRSRNAGYYNDFIFAIMATVPAILLHELGHKFVAMNFGMNAVFHAAYLWLGIGLLLKLFNFGFIFLVPAFVSITGNGTSLQYAMVAFAGPLVNLILWAASYILLKYKLVNKKYEHVLIISKRINLFLFVFNMLPIPSFDGFSVFSGLFHAFF